MKPIMSTFRSPAMSGLIIKDDFTHFETLGEIKDYAASLGPVSGEEEAATSKDSSPIPQTKDREHYHGDAHAAWWLSGFRDLQGIAKAAERLGIEMDKARYYEMGCASGRVVRHVAHQTGAEVWCSDINLRHTEWVRKFLPSSIKVFNSTSFPSLPLDSKSFDIVSAFSVFTHIDDQEFHWLAELRRILRPGGIAYLTIQSEHTWARYRQEWIKDVLVPLKDQITDIAVDDSLFEGELPLEKTVFWWGSRDVYNSTVFHSTDYIRREWGRFFNVVDIIREGTTYQDVVILQRPL